MLVVPISDVRAATLIEPGLADDTGRALGVAMTPRVGEINKSYLDRRAGVLEAGSVESLVVALRAVLDL